MERSVALNPDIGDSWAQYYNLELSYGTVEQQQQIKERCVKADPKHGEYWCKVSKDIKNWRKNNEEILVLVAQQLVTNK